MKRSKNVQTVIDLCLEHGFEIVSFGLAPNPNGFCFEMSEIEDATKDEIKEQKLNAKRFSKMLDALTSKQEQELRAYILGDGE